MIVSAYIRMKRVDAIRLNPPIGLNIIWEYDSTTDEYIGYVFTTDNLTALRNNCENAVVTDLPPKVIQQKPPNISIDDYVAQNGGHIIRDDRPTKAGMDLIQELLSKPEVKEIPRPSTPQKTVKLGLEEANI